MDERLSARRTSSTRKMEIQQQHHQNPQSQQLESQQDLFCQFSRTDDYESRKKFYSRDNSDEMDSTNDEQTPRLRRHCSERGSREERRSTRTRSVRDRRSKDSSMEGGGRNRSLSCRGSRKPLRPTELNFEEPRRRTYSMPSKSCRRAFVESYNRQPPEQESTESNSDEFYRVRTFSTSSKRILNKGDSFKRRDRSSTSDQGASSASVAATSAQVVPLANVKVNGNSHPTGNGSKTTHKGSLSRVIVVGSQGVGKSAIIRQFSTSDYLGTADLSDQAEDGESRTVSIILDDEEETVELYHRLAIEESPSGGSRAAIDAYCIVYSVSDRDSFFYATDQLSELKRFRMIKSSAGILVANKADLVRQRQVTEDEGKLTAARFKSKYVEVSAVLNHKIDDLLVGIVKQIRLRRRQRQRIQTTSTDDSGCYPAREIVDLILGKQRRLFNSCDDLMVL